MVVRATERNEVLDQISARAARYKPFDKDTYNGLMALRADVRDAFNKGQPVGDLILKELYFLDSSGKEFVNALSGNFERVVTPADFNQIAKIMSEHMGEQVPILKSFTSFFGRLAEDFLVNAKPKTADFDWKSIFTAKVFGNRRNGYILPDRLSELLGIKAGEPVSEKFMKKLGIHVPGNNLDTIINGKMDSTDRRMGAEYFKLEPLQLKKLFSVKVFKSGTLPKAWTNVPNVNFDGKKIEQHYTQTFEERLAYKEGDQWSTNIVQIDQKTDPTPWEAIINKDGKINDIADITAARTAFGVNSNHSKHNCCVEIP